MALFDLDEVGREEGRFALCFEFFGMIYSFFAFSTRGGADASKSQHSNEAAHIACQKPAKQKNPSSLRRRD